MNKPIMLTNPKDLEVKKSVEKISKEYLLKMQKTKEKIVKRKLKEIKMLNVLRDFEKRRFKKLMIENLPDREVVWVDNGTLKGLRLVTFLKFTEAEIRDEQFKWQLKWF